MKIELLAPAGNMEKLKTSINFGADAVYLAGKNYGLRAFSDNFNKEELATAVQFCHNLNKKVYVTLNIFAHNSDFIGLKEYLQYLECIKVDAIIVSDPGILSQAKTYAPNLSIHISTQSNITNKYSAKFWVEQGAERLVLARELDLAQIREIKDYLPDVELESFVHGAMCMSYSGRCMLSNYLADRPSNKGECAQSCRWEYAVVEKTRGGEYMDVVEDERGTYIFNSKDMNMLAHIDKLYDAGITSFKIEGRVKTAYYVANTINAYRRAIDFYLKNPTEYKVPKELLQELIKSSHRKYFTGFYLNDKDSQCLDTSKPLNGDTFCAIVLDNFDGGVIIEQRNRFKVGEELEILSPTDLFNKKIKISKMTNSKGEIIEDALRVQEKLHLYTDLKLQKGDILRKE